MKRWLVGALVSASLALGGCASLDSATVSSTEVAAEGGDAIALIQATALGWTLFFHLIDIVHSDFDTSVNRLLVSVSLGERCEACDVGEQEGRCGVSGHA